MKVWRSNTAISTAGMPHMLCVQPPITSTAWVTTILTLKWWYVRVGSEMGTSCRMRQPKSSYGATVIDARASHVIFPLG